jgi:hypothetical protein
MTLVKSISIKDKIYAAIENILSIEIIKLCTFIITFYYSVFILIMI